MDAIATLRARPLVIAVDAAVRETVLRLCAAAGTTPDVVDNPDHARDLWRRAACVVVDAGAATQVRMAALPRRHGVLLVTDGEPATQVWKDAVAVGAEQVVVLPGGQDHLTALLADTEGGVARARSLGVIGARGGVGASVCAASIALHAAKQGTVCLVDADPLAGGIDLVLGDELGEGLRWPDVAVTRGRVTAAALRAALPTCRQVTVLSWDRGSSTPLSAQTMASMATAVRRAFELVVFDLPRMLDAAAEQALAACDRVLLVVTCDVRSLAGATALLPRLSRHGPDIQVVARAARPVVVTPEAIAESVGLPLAGVLPSRRSAGRAIDEGFGPPLPRRAMLNVGEIVDRVFGRAT